MFGISYNIDTLTSYINIQHIPRRLFSLRVLIFSHKVYAECLVILPVESHKERTWVKLLIIDGCPTQRERSLERERLSSEKTMLLEYRPSGLRYHDCRKDDALFRYYQIKGRLFFKSPSLFIFLGGFAQKSEKKAV